MTNLAFTSIILNTELAPISITELYEANIGNKDEGAYSRLSHETTNNQKCDKF